MRLTARTAVSRRIGPANSPEIAEIVKASAKAAIENPTEITELTEYAKDPIENLKALVESADFTNTEWNETAIAAKAAGVLSEKAGAKVNSVSVSGNTATITLRYGYSETAATIYTPSDAAAQWTAYIESTNLGSTTVPGSDMKYSEVPAIQAALAKGYLISGPQRRLRQRMQHWKHPRKIC